MNESKLSFKLLSHTKRENGTIASYTIEVTSLPSDRIEILEVNPNDLASARSMKRLLLDRGIFYSTSQKKHAEAIAAMFDTRNAETEQLCLD